MEHSKIYHESLIESCQQLADYHENLLSQVVNLAMSGELSSVDQIFEVNESMVFKQSDFEKLDDLNIQCLMTVLKAIKECHDSLLNINNLNKYDE